MIIDSILDIERILLIFPAVFVSPVLGVEQKPHKVNAVPLNYIHSLNIVLILIDKHRDQGVQELWIQTVSYWLSYRCFWWSLEICFNLEELSVPPHFSP